MSLPAAPRRRTEALQQGNGPAFRLDGASQGNSQNLPDAQVIQAVQAAVDLIMPALDSAESALTRLTEDAVADGLQAGIRTLRSSLTAFMVQLPTEPRDYEEVVSSWEVQRQAAAQDGVVLGPAISAEEVASFTNVARAVLDDVCTALVDISRDEVEELAEVGLTASRLAVSAAQSAVQRLQESLQLQEQPGRVVIEELGEESSTAEAQETRRGQTRRSRDENVRIRMCQPRRRLLWPPLWPLVKHQISELLEAPELLSLSLHRCCCKLSDLKSNHKGWSVLLAASLPIWLPLSGFTLCLSVFAAPWLLLVDSLLQRFYKPRAKRLEEVADGCWQVARLWYVAGRLAMRRASRLMRSMVHRSLAGRSLTEAALEGLEEVRKDPLAAASAAARVTARGLKQAFKAARATWSKLPPTEKLLGGVKGLWSPDASA
mmetsp:Transcript_61824/g.109789  ORF Transcript_61824/g.109789 Transcript_61824/m.109789 type:complete len:432 (+) Transcript_61824:35-1330(+)